MEKIAEQNLLEKLLQYNDENVIARFTDMFDIPEDEANDILKETLKFLSIAHLPGVFISDDLLVLDEMWHNMILFTPQYHTFSQTYFNIPYLHHLPSSKIEKEKQARLYEQNPQKAQNDFLDKMEVLISTVYDELGEDTVRKWFQDFPVKYSKEKLNALRK